VFQEIQILRFLGDNVAVSRHEVVPQWITDRGNVTRAEVETFYRNGIRGFITEIVDEEFNKVSFLLENSNTYSRARSHNAVLTRNPQTGQYILSYGGTYTNGETRTIISSSVDELSSAMRTGQYRTDFDQIGIDAVRSQAQLIPAVVYADWKARELGDGMELIKETITYFYLNPNSNA